MANKVRTTKIGGGADYAKVADRLKVFWEENPNGKIDSERENLAEGKIRFVARIWRDSTEILKLAQAGTTADVIKMTANATASADAVKKGDKENEKLETVAVGRALAMLGYLASGEVASREEMEEFEDYKATKQQEAVEAAWDELIGAQTIEDLKNTFIGLDPTIRNDESVIAKKDERKKELTRLQVEKAIKLAEAKISSSFEVPASIRGQTAVGVSAGATSKDGRGAQEESVTVSKPKKNGRHDQQQNKEIKQ